MWRQELESCPSRHYHPGTNRALSAVIFGIIGEVGEIDIQQIVCPLAFERVHTRKTRARPVYGATCYAGQASV